MRKAFFIGTCLSALGTTLSAPMHASPVTAAPVSLVASATAKPSADSVQSANDLFALMAKSPGVFARFEEERRIALLAAPMRSSGTLHFDRKNGLVRHTEKPKKQSLRLQGSNLTIWDGSKLETVSLQNPTLRAFAEAFVRFLASDRSGLEKDFQIGFAKSGADAWKLTLVPKAEALKGILQSLEVTGRMQVASKLVVLEASGDSSTLTFSEVDTDRRYAEEDPVFAVPPKP
jgi:Outer membrane lipoprotein carrier protein LolA